MITLAQLLPLMADTEWAEVLVQGLSLDSRAVVPGGVFVAVPGTLVDGRLFVDAAFSAGALVALIHTDQEPFSFAKNEDKLVVKVPHLAAEVSELAGRFYQHPSQQMRCIGITGTNGKTTCSAWLAQMAEALELKGGCMGTLGFGRMGHEWTDTGMTTPDPIAAQRILAQLQREGIDWLAAEVSSHSLVQHRVSAVAFEVALVTTIGRDHLDFHGDMDAYVEAKKQLLEFSSLKSVVLNRDDAYFAEFFAVAKPDARRLVTYGFNAEADIRAESLQYDASGVHFTLRTPEGDYPVTLSLWGQFNVANLLAVTSVAWVMGISIRDIIATYPQLRPVPGRLQPVEPSADVTVLVDFAHTPDALESVLRGIRHHSQQHLWCVFGCGGDRDKGKRPQMAQIAEYYADRVVVTSDNPRSEDPVAIIDEIKQGFSQPEQILFFPDREQAIQMTIALAGGGDIVVIAGKGHEDYQIVGTEKLPFSDLASAKRALGQRGHVKC